MYALARYYFETEEYEKAVELYKKASEQGESRSCIELAKLHYHGALVEQDKAKAFELLKYAASEGYGEGAYLLAQYLLLENENENRNDEDIQEALQILEALANNDYAQAQYLLGIIYLFKDFVEQDHALGAEWLKRAAENNDIDAQMVLAKCYEEGRGVQKNKYDAISWYRKAGAQGLEEANERANELEDF
jgi:TPR repeat protein